MLCLALLCLGAQAQSYDYLMKGRAAKKAGGGQLDSFKKELAQLSKDKKEGAMIDALYGYYGIGDEEAANALDKAIKKKFPRGVMMRNDDAQKIKDSDGAAAMEKAYNAWAKKYPEKKLGKSEIYAQTQAAVASAYAKEGNVDKAMEYLRKMDDTPWKCYAYSTVASQLDDAKQAEAAGLAYKEGAGVADGLLPTLQGRDKSVASMVYEGYAEWLAKNGHADEAWSLYNDKVQRKEGSTEYWKLALRHGQVMQAWTYMDGLLRKGYAGKDGEDVMREAWRKANGNDDGFDEYVKAANQERIDEKVAKVADKMVNKPAPDFTLKDIDGNEVQLSKLRGKVVVLDFWATWCGPCKRSLPAMKKTLAKYKDDADVVFLFIHTWERGTAEEANKEAKAYLRDHGFDEFHLVMDTRDPETKVNKAVTAFGVRGIPAKFVIDKQGNIRFEVSGFGGSDDDAVAELSKMIELARGAK